jgi:hypothetical protein
MDLATVTHCFHKITHSAVLREHWPRARARFKNEIAKLPLRMPLGSVKIQGGTTPQAFFVNSLSCRKTTSRQIMMDLADFVHESKGSAINSTELGALDKLQLYRLYRNLKGKGEVKAALNDQIQEMARWQLKDKEVDLLTFVTSMRDALVNMESAVKEVLGNKSIAVSFENAAVNGAMKDQIVDALEDAWDSVKRTGGPPLGVVKHALIKPSLESPNRLESNLNLIHLNSMLSDDGRIDRALLRKTLVPALHQAGERHPEATARQIASILSRKQERIHLHGLFYGLRIAIYQQLEGKRGAGAELLNAVAAIKQSEGRWEELRVPDLAKAAESPLSVWAAVHELASYAHSSDDFAATVKKVLEEQKHMFHGETARKFLKLADSYVFRGESRHARRIRLAPWSRR